jgi:hypothetical protein
MSGAESSESPFEVLGVAFDADDADVRRAYAQKLRAAKAAAESRARSAEKYGVLPAPEPLCCAPARRRVQTLATGSYINCIPAFRPARSTGCTARESQAQPERRERRPQRS